MRSPDDNSGRGRHRRRGVWSSRVLIGTGLVLLLLAGGWQGYAWLWMHHSDQVGSALITRQQGRDRSAAATALPGCGHASSSSPATPATATRGTAGSGGGSVASAAQLPAGSQGAPGTSGGATPNPVHGLLAIPNIGLVAPVEQGVGDPQLAVAVGHIPASVWPGATGTSILAAHDVSYFVHIDRLQTGDRVSFATPCTTYQFAVSGHQVVKQGSPVYNSPGPTLMLETCWPTDALWYTPDRLLVTATLTAAVPTTTQSWARTGGIASGSAQASSGASVAGTSPPRVPAPGALVAQGLTLATNSIPMGTLAIKGTPTTTWTQSPGPLAVESSALQAFIGGLKAAEQQVSTWWAALAPGVTMPTVLGGARVSDWHQGLDVAIYAKGSSADGVILVSVITLVGGPSPGTYTQTVGAVITHGELTVRGWALAPYTG